MAFSKTVLVPFLLMSAVSFGLDSGAVRAAPSGTPPNSPPSTATPGKSPPSGKPESRPPPTSSPLGRGQDPSLVEGSQESDDTSATRNAARTRMHECGHQWSSMKKSGAATGLTWKDFSQSCLARK